MRVRDDIQAGLRVAMRGRDRSAIVALRTALAALANAEAVPIDSAPLEVHGHLAQHARRELTEVDVRDILQSQIDDRRQTIAELLPHGRDAEVATLRAEINVLRGYVAEQP